MAPVQEKSSLKRARDSTGGNSVDDSKKVRRSDRLNAPPVESHLRPGPLPSPVTRKGTASTEDFQARTASPPGAAERPATPISSPPIASQYLHTPPRDTQAFSQFIPPAAISYEVDDEKKEGVWGYLVPTEGSPVSDPLVLKPRAACPVPEKAAGEPNGRQAVSKQHWKEKEAEYEQKKATNGTPANGYLIGRHPECDRIISSPTVSNRHCLIWAENREGGSCAMVEDLSGNGTYVNDALLGRNNRRELQDADEISIVNEARFIFRYPHRQESNSFNQEYSIKGQLGKGHFATVYLALEKKSGKAFAVKKFEKRRGPSEKSRTEGLKQEIAVLMSVSHPNMLCLKDTFDESDGVYLILELAPEGELFNWIVRKQKLTEQETRKVFIQLFQGVKYLVSYTHVEISKSNTNSSQHERNIVHRDIKPENILVIDQTLNIKLADFGLAKIIGEESFTTTLCGTPSYVAPEILVPGDRRRYTKAVDVWSLGVVLYICLCGFPPFSDELYHKTRYPYTLSDQIKQGKFDFPQPYWDSVSDDALYLIDRMIEVDMDKRITIDECLEHPWTTQRTVSVTDSTDGLTGALAGMDFSQRRVKRERTLLASINDVRVERVVETQTDEPPVKIFDKNPQGRPQLSSQKQAAVRAAQEAKLVAAGGPVRAAAEQKPDADRDPQEFVAMGGKGDETLFGDNSGSYYPEDIVKTS